MQVIARDSRLWNYITPEIRDLIEDGEIILNFVHDNKHRAEISDFSFIVFPFAKAYEGFLKRFFLDSGLITEDEYFGDEIRIGRLLNPNYEDNSSVYKRICNKPGAGRNVPERLWGAWKKGRNLVFHYFPNNFRKLSYDESLDIINDLINAMAEVVSGCIS
ncbi:hypothetical protein GYA37_03055 [candidate division WWE3 bacterium]|uniref:Bacterial toxin RNase RnlA/LsoA DBD domain-containing protein n=1 Tax=candidate division WWE3 bacterium TaxID=2053526 RepID=A0A7X9E796_UNCKA|nr:hypothetical protein [candidate division WWE3 bacterium]